MVVMVTRVGLGKIVTLHFDALSFLAETSTAGQCLRLLFPIQFSLDLDIAQDLAIEYAI